MPAQTAFKHYQQIRRRLPEAPLCNHQPKPVENVLALAAQYDTFFFDAFGVLNVGQQAIPDAVTHIATLRSMGKNITLLSNAASYDKSRVLTKFRHFGFDFAIEEIVTSRDALLAGLSDYPDNLRWGIIATRDGQSDLIERKLNLVFQDEPDFLAADGFLFLSTVQWDEQRQYALLNALNQNPRPLLLGNPDLIAPMGQYSSTEPGSYVLLLEDHLFDHARVFGKPFHNIYDMAAKNLYYRGKPLNHSRTVMLGDTLHTDILGGNAYGIATALVTDHGFFRELDPMPYIAESGIVPDYTMPQI